MRRLVLVPLLLAAFSLGGCATVQPFQRGILADPMMSFDPQEDPTASIEGTVNAVNFNEHSLVYTGGGSGSVAGGCPSCK